MAAYFTRQKNRFDLSVVMPAYNEEKNIERVLSKTESTLRDLKIRYEIIVINDGSSDSTKKRVIKYASRRRHIRLITRELNRGKGLSVKEGVLSAQGDAIAIIDSDLDIDITILGRYLETLKDADICIASKRHPDSDIKSLFTRKFLSAGFNFLINLLLGLRTSDTQAGLKMGKRWVLRRIFKSILIKRYAFDVEMILASKILNFRLVEMPVKIKLSSQFKLKDAIRMFIDVLAIAYRFRIRRWYQKGLK